MGVKQVFKSGLGDVFYYTSNQQTLTEQLGTIRFENNAVYKYVSFAGTTTVNVGDVICYVAAASDGLEQIVDGANTALGAGVSMCAVATGTKTTGAVAYATGWVQIKGFANVSTTVGGAPTIGQALFTASPAATLRTALTQQIVGYFYNTKQIICDFPF